MTVSISRRHALALAGAAIASGALAPGRVSAQAYPSRSVLVVVPFAAGGGVDVATRLVTEKMSAILGPRLVVENRGGGATVVGSQGVARAAGDGYTLLAAPTTMVINPSFRDKLPFDWEKDFVPVGMLATLPFVVVAANDFPASGMKELAEVGRTRKDPLTFGSGGTGTVAHLAGELFAIRSGAKMQHVPYRGEAPSLTDVIAGRLSVTFSTLASASGQIEGKTLKALAVTTRGRTALLPGVPTVSEQGFPDYDISAWVALVAPKGTLPEVVATLNRALNEATKTDDVRRQLATVGAEPGGGTPEELAATMKHDAEIWAGVIKTANVKPE